jgi:putative DNA primase/helicase
MRKNSNFEPLAKVRSSVLEAKRLFLRAHGLAKDAVRPTALRSFENWSSTVRGALVRLGIAYPVETMKFVRSSDTKLKELAMVLANWEKVLGTGRTSVAGIIKTANTEKLGDYLHGDFRDALLAVAGIGGAISARRLGKWLASNRRRSLKAAAFVAMRISIKWRIGASN